MSKEAMKRRLDDARRNERHHNLAETRYWLDQYKQIANEAVKVLAEQPAQQQGCEFCTHHLYAGTKCKNCKREQPAQQEPAGWRPATFHRDNLSFNPGFPDEQTVKFWKLQGVEIEYCYTSPLLLSPGATFYTSPPAQRTWVGLTDEKADELVRRFARYELLRAIETELRSKNEDRS